MPEVSSHAAGSFCWVELATTDPQAAKKFYGGLFGWTPVDSPAGPDMVYTLLQINGKDVGALYPLTPDMLSQGVPPNWGTYVSVSSADEAAKKAKSLGGNVLMEPFDVMEHGRMTIVQDPTGAAISLWQARNHIGVRLIGEPNTFCWNELQTNDTAKASDFYTKLFGWTAKTDEGPTQYTEWINNGSPIGGMMKMGDQMAGVPPHWLPYFMVADCNATADKAKSAGAKLYVPPTDIPKVGTFSVIADPQGAVFAIIKLTHQ
ncbi:MAG TPA: VOC family protein [Blastocatellia bacterium]|nr:VOC family protein [Blastocatellia bacterium]